MFTKRILFAAAVLMTWSTGFCLDSGTLVESNTAFFAQQSPLMTAQAQDELGVSSPNAHVPDKTADYKSPSWAALYSLLLPGLGEIYVGDSRTRAAGFLAADVGIWSTFILFRNLGKWKKDDYIELAVVYAGIDPSGKGEFFYDRIGFYENRDEYNKVSRVYTRTNPFFPETPAWDWQWQGADHQAEYRNLKNESKAAYRNARFALAVAAINRAASMIFAWRAANDHNRDVADEFSRFNLEIMPDFSCRSVQVRLGYTASF